ncbi:hypothetical protein [Methylocapsa palsarum]|uniref:Uncharacterized protein n=1 Tax=Methylocapsa palsarum TaxID=1612308 RepID=A0A1I3WRN2_9HYPH|nr:hypothetical protein [Methylocapsa palsarum]SFK10132.1 hypothetical protein SAMN05444581_10291 [Methylocapsa palsarum]
MRDDDDDINDVIDDEGRDVDDAPFDDAALADLYRKLDLDPTPAPPSSETTPDSFAWLDAIDAPRADAPRAHEPWGDPSFSDPRLAGGLACTFLRERPKAVCFEVYADGREIWLPKSAFNLVRDGAHYAVCYPDRLAKDKDLPRTTGYNRRTQGRAPETPRLTATPIRDELAALTNRGREALEETFCEVPIVDVVHETAAAVFVQVASPPDRYGEVTPNEVCLPKSQSILLGDPPHTAVVPKWLARNISKEHRIAHGPPLRLARKLAAGTRRAGYNKLDL